mmetsp:Transcript_17184/g.15181  ORF Transcript_17184/g.15181 Transcript_17184/m.15181 type:complete len:134 (+) Transcript_17184:1022-1423(+)
MSDLKSNFMPRDHSPSSWKKKLKVSNSKLSILLPEGNLNFSFVGNKKELDSQLELIHQKYNLKRFDVNGKSSVEKRNKQSSILHNTLEGLLRKNIIDTALFNEEKSGDFFSINKLSSYVNKLSRKDIEKIIFK